MTDSDAAFTVLLVEDDPADATLARHALKASRFLCDLHVVRDGVEAMAFLRREPPFTQAPRPDLILLDLNMPRKDGREVLKEIREDPVLRSYPVVIMTTSDVDRDISASYFLGANSFVTKPIDVDAFMRVVQDLGNYWFTVVKLPQ